jgi:hypothetical protein
MTQAAAPHKADQSRSPIQGEVFFSQTSLWCVRVVCGDAVLQKSNGFHTAAQAAYVLGSMLDLYRFQVAA